MSQNKDNKDVGSGSSDTGGSNGNDSTEKGFLETALPDLSDKSPEEVEKILNQVANNITLEQVQHQNEILDNDVASMKQFMDKAVNEGVLVDDVDENADDGTILLKNKAGDYNPIGDLIAKKRSELDARLASLEEPSSPKEASFEDTQSPTEAVNDDGDDQRSAAHSFRQEQTATKKKQQTLSKPFGVESVLKSVVVHIPISGEVPGDEALRYASAVVQDCYQHGEAPVCPLLQTAVSIGFGKITDEVRRITTQTMVAVRQSIGELRVYIDCDTKREFDGTFTKTTLLRSLNPKVQKELADAKNSALPIAVDADGKPVAQEEAPDKTRVNRYTRDEQGKPVAEFPPGVAGFAADGTAIPIDNSGKAFNPRVPNVLGDMEYRNSLLSTPTYDPKDWYYKRYDKNRYIVVAYMGPKNCNLKHKDYFMCVFAAVRSKSECAAVIDHVRKKKNCYHGKMFNLGVVDIGEWFATAPPRFAKDAKASYSNPLHREYMDAYINEQKRATVELEQRVLDDEVRARQKTNTMIEQLQQKGMNPDLAPTNAQVQHDIEQQQRENAKQALQHKKLAAEAARRKTAAEAQAAQSARKRNRAPIGPQSSEQRPEGVPETQQAAALVGGVRRPMRGRGRGRGRGGPTRAVQPQGTPIDI